MTKFGVEVIAIFGPTGSGKTEVAELLASRLGTEIVSADALQVYRGLEVITNQPHRPTRLVAIQDVSDEMSVGRYARLAHDAIDELIDRNGVAIVAGGTGLYLRAALVDMAIPPAPAAGARARWERVYDADPDAAHEALVERDPRAASVVHRNDRRRVVRALELAESGGSLVPTADRLWSEEMRRPALVVGLDLPVDELDRRIEARAQGMVARGAAEEARAAHRSSISRTASKALGLEELATLPADQALEGLILRTKKYAAYQRKWMRRIPGIHVLDATRPAEEVVDAIVDLARAR